jgi:hypothetical protein
VETGRLVSLPSPRGAIYGAFLIVTATGEEMRIISSGRAYSEENPTKWEHVSVSFVNRCPTWTEMCWVKGQFWSDTETVVQLHPPRHLYVNTHPFCLHLWKNCVDGHELPPRQLV